MNNPQEPRVIRYCHECGHKVDPSRPSCWYCGTQLRRSIRPPRFCQFCGSEIPRDALKCKHCGEWVDGRPSEKNAPQQVVFVVDRELLGSMRDMQLLGGAKVPPDIAAYLPPRTVQAIESSRPAMIEGPGVRALPAPSDLPDSGGQIIDVPSDNRDLVVRARKNEPRASRDLQRRNADLAQTGAESGGGGLMKWIGGALMKSSPAYRRGQAADAPHDIDADAGDLYRACEKCGAEILRGDNYCYHCGMRYHKSAIDMRIERARSVSSNMGLFLVIVVLNAIMSGLLKFGDSLPEPFRPQLLAIATGGVAVLLSIFAYTRRPGIVSRALAIALALAAIYLHLTIKP